VPGALDAAARAVALAPGLAQAHYTLGLAQLANYQPQDQAGQDVTAALQRAPPGCGTPWVNLGLAH